MLSRTHFPNLRHHVSASIASVFVLRCTLGLLLGLATMNFLISVIFHVVRRSGNRSPCRQLSGTFPSANTYAPREVVESKRKVLANPLPQKRIWRHNSKVTHTHICVLPRRGTLSPPQHAHLESCLASILAVSFAKHLCHNLPR